MLKVVTTAGGAMRRLRPLSFVMLLMGASCALVDCGGEEFSSDTAGSMQASGDLDGAVKDGAVLDTRLDAPKEMGAGGAAGADARTIDATGEAAPDSGGVGDAPSEPPPGMDAANDGTVSVDAGTPDVACTPITFYLDSDHDGFGGTATMTACEAPGGHWVTKGGDCDDGNLNVFPKQRGLLRHNVHAQRDVRSFRTTTTAAALKSWKTRARPRTRVRVRYWEGGGFARLRAMSRSRTWGRRAARSTPGAGARRWSPAPVSVRRPRR